MSISREASEALRIADKHLAGKPTLVRRALAKEIFEALNRYAALHDALNQLVGWVEECGSAHEGREYCLTEARAALKGFTVVPTVTATDGKST